MLHNNSCLEIPQPLALYNVLNFLNSLLFFLPPFSMGFAPFLGTFPLSLSLWFCVPLSSWGGGYLVSFLSLLAFGFRV